MGLESGTFVSDLVATNPPSGDGVSQGDDHLRLLKTVLRNTFPNATKAFYFPDSTVKNATGNIVAADMNKTLLVDTTSVSVTLTLPSLVAADAGWEVNLVKTNVGLNPCFVAPASGTIQSGEVAGLTKIRRCIPGSRTKIVWTGSNWFAERVVRTPVGCLIPFVGVALPVGYEWPNGQTLSSSANYPEYNAVRGALTTPDLRGRAVVAKDDMGGTSANRLTGLSGGVNGDLLEATGGEEAHVVTTPEMPSHNHTATVTDPGHTHPVRGVAANSPAGAGNAYITQGSLGTGSPQGSTDSSGINGTGISVSTVAAGGGGAHNNVQPTIIENYILVVE